jgi:hypothetical protein
MGLAAEPEIQLTEAKADRVTVRIGTLSVDSDAFAGPIIPVKIDGQEVLVRALSLKFIRGKWQILADVVPVPAGG